ncbi:MAG: ABC transporter permease [Candidatus Thermoplasmatota archaeon]|nr:ABC transporter permease [Candidatus Thermoplasmatota archaeon]
MIIKGLSYYLKRIVKQPTFIFLVAFILITSFLVIYTSARVPLNEQNYVLSGIYDDNGTVNLSTYSMNCMGQPLRGIEINITVFGKIGSPTVPQNMTFPDLVSNDEGYANLTLGNYSQLSGVILNIQVLSKDFSFTGQGNLRNIAVRNNSYSIVPQLVINASNPYHSIPFIAYFGPNGTSAPPVTLYSKNITPSSFSPEPVNLTLVGTYSHFHLLTVNGVYGGPSDPDKLFFLYIGGNSNNSTYYTFSGSVYAPPPDLANTISFMGEIWAVTGFLITVTAIIVIEMMYSRELANGTLDLVLSQPISKRKLMLDRFTSSAIVMVLTLLGIVAFDDISFYLLAGRGLPVVLIESVIFGVLIAMMSIMGFSVLFSRFRRYGFYFTISLFVLFAFGSLFGGSEILSAYGNTPSSLPAYIQFIYLLSPTNFLDLFANSISPGITSYFQPNYIPSDLYFPLSFVILIGLVWAVFPVLLAYLANGNRRI